MDLTPSEDTRMKEHHLKLGGSSFRTEKGGASLCNAQQPDGVSPQKMLQVQGES